MRKVFTDERIVELVKMYAAGKTWQECADALSVAPRTVRNIYYVSPVAKAIRKRLQVPRRDNPHRLWTNDRLNEVITLHCVEGKSLRECADILSLAAKFGLAAAIYSRRGQKLRKQRGLYRPRNQALKLMGKRFGKLRVVRRVDLNRWNAIRWLCACSCGAKTIATGSNLTRGKIRSCGGATHKLSGKDSPSYKHGGTCPKMRPTWNSYYAMLSRCLKPDNISYDHYGGRGITVCAGWQGPNGFTNFLASVGRRPKDKTLDRIYPHGHYSCGSCTQCLEKGWTPNCRWATDKVQANNKRRHYPPLSQEEVAALMRSCEPPELGSDQNPY